MNANEQIIKPEAVKDEHLIYLDGLRESGVTNMWGAGVYLERVFSLDRKTASAILVYWIKTFSIRHPQKKKGQDHGKTKKQGKEAYRSHL